MSCGPTCACNTEPGLPCLSRLNPARFGFFRDFCALDESTPENRVKRKHVLERTRLAFSSAAHLSRVLAPIAGGSGGGCDCNCGTICVSPSGCGNVTWSAGGYTIVGTGCTPAMFAAGSYAITPIAVPEGIQTPATGTATLTGQCSTSTYNPAIAVAAGYTAGCCAAGASPCSGYGIKTTLTLSDGIGAVTLTRGISNWTGTATRSATQTADATACNDGGPLLGAGSVAVNFTLTCSGGKFFLVVDVPSCQPDAALGLCAGFPATTPYIPNPGGTVQAGTSGIGQTTTAVCSPFSTSIAVSFGCTTTPGYWVYGGSQTFSIHE